MNLRLTLKATIFSAAALTASAALAQSSISVRYAPEEVVSYADLNIGHSAGRAALNGRIRAAAERLCQPNIAGIMRERTDRRTCFDSAVDGAQQQVQLALAQPGEGRGGQRRSIAVIAR